MLREQLIQAGQTNLTLVMEVYVTGRVLQTVPVTLPQGSSLVHAVDLAGGTKVLHGKVEFIRLKRGGELDRRVFSLKSDAPSGDYRNPILTSGDVIRIRETPLTKTASVINEVTGPVLGAYSLYAIFDDSKTMINSPSAIHTNSPTTKVDDEINFREILATLVRQKNLIAFFTFIAVLFSAGFAATRKPLWEGRFQIVLENGRSGASTTGGLSQLLQTNTLVANLASMSGASGNQLGTQVKVLESPLVLKPTYEFVKTSKVQNGESIKNWSFLDWRNKSLKVELQKGTSVLNITYRDMIRTSCFL